METLIASWKDSPKSFLISGSLIVSYGKFYDDLLKMRLEIKKCFNEKQLFVIESANNYETYLKFLTLILERHIVFLVPSYQFGDTDYWEMLEKETQSKFLRVPAGMMFTGVTGISSTENPLLLSQLASNSAAFLVRTSGTSGKKFKFILHNPLPFMEKYRLAGNQYKITMAFFPADSIAGIETLLETFTYSTTLITDSDKLTPLHVKELLEKHQIDYFFTTPSFLNLMLITNVFSQTSLKALKAIAYGSEPISANTLLEIRNKLNHIEFNHKYGMSEIGILVSSTNQVDPSMFMLDEKINQKRIVDGVLEINTPTKCIGYLNYQNAEGPWFRTGDVVAFDPDGFMKIIGRSDDLINVAGRKFYPSEVEDLLIKIEGTKDVVVISEKNEIIGNILIAKFFIDQNIDEMEFRKKLKIYCENHVPHFMCPHKVLFLTEPPITSRFKKSRTA